MWTTEWHEVCGGDPAPGLAVALPPAASRGVTLLVAPALAVGATLVLT